ncbi:2-hydroxyacid dehydrogenase [Verrucomicrobiaceae bacterium 227]
MKIAFFDTKPYDRKFFSESSHDIDFFECRLSPQTLSLAKGHSAVCIFVNDQADRACLQSLSELGIKHLALRCAGFNNVDLAAADEFGITITRVPAYSPHAVAEHTVALLLTLNRQIHRAYNRVREHNFSLAGLVGFDLHGKTAGILGAGQIGKITAGILKAFGCRVLVYDAFPDSKWLADTGAEEASLTTVLEQADIVSLHLPLTPETHHLINADALARMKPGAFLINTGRGKLIDTAALISALKNRRLGGVALDVYEEEEGVFFEDLSNTILEDDELSRLLTFPNVLVTSHQGFLTNEALTEIARITCENFSRAEKGESYLEETIVRQK